MNGIPLRTLIILLFCAALAGAADDGPETVRRVDDLLRPDQSFSVETRIDAYRDRSPVGSLVLLTFVRVPADDTEPAALSLALEPQAERGKVILRQPDGTFWLLDPGAQRPVKLTNQQHLRGEMSLDDLTPLRLSADYTASADGDEKIMDAAGKTVSARRFVLSAKTKVAPYSEVRLWTDGLFVKPVKLACLAAGGRTMRTVFFSEFRGFLGKERPTEWTIVDGTRPGRVTRLRFSDYRRRELPPELYDPNRLRDAAAIMSTMIRPN